MSKPFWFRAVATVMMGGWLASSGCSSTPTAGSSSAGDASVSSGSGGSSGSVLADGAVASGIETAVTPAGESLVRVTSLVCEYLTNPIAIDVPAPRLSWALESNERGQKQTAYQIIASTEQDTLWDTGKVVSNRQTHI